MIALTRRTLLASGAATLVAPRFLAACAHPDVTTAAAAGVVPADPFRSWFGIDGAMVRRVMTELTSRGADFADLYFQHTRNTSISLEDGLISKASTSIDQGVGLRVVVGDQIGYAFTEDLTEESMLGAARLAAAIASGSAATAPVEFKPRERASGLYQIQVPWSAVGIERRLPILSAIETAAKAKDPSIAKVSVSWSDGEERVAIADLEGNLHLDTRPMMRVWCSLTAKRGEQTVSNSSNLAGRHGIEWMTDQKVQELVQQAADRTLVLFDAKRPPAGVMPVVLAAGASGILLHEAIGHGMEADYNRKGMSIYSDMLNKPIAPDFVTIVDSGTEPGERGALEVDDEGSDGQRTVLVDKGILRTYLHDRISAKHYGVASTGSGRRESFRHMVLPRMRCTFMEDGPHTKDEIVASVQNGIIAETFTNGQVQIGAGDFTFYIKNGWLIENGRVTAPIKDVNIIGNGPEALRRVTMAANDGKLDTGGWTCGKQGQSVPVSQGLPTVLVSEMTVGGEHA